MCARGTTSATLSLDVGVMYRLQGRLEGGQAQSAMLRPMIGYGLTGDVQLSISLPVPLYTPATAGTPPRMMGMMPARTGACSSRRWARSEPTT
jgi:hypothetical protein